MRMHEELQDKLLPRHVCDICGKSFKVNFKVKFSSDLELRNEIQQFSANIWILKLRFCFKVVVFSDLRSRNVFKLFPANIWIFKFFILIVFAIKMLLDKPYGLLSLFPANIWILKLRFCLKVTTKMITFNFKKVQ